MGWTIFFLFVVLKLPILAACWIVWWAVRAEPDPSEDASGDDDGGTGRPPHGSPRLPRAPRRGPHGEPPPTSPPRVRHAKRRSRTPHR